MIESIILFSQLNKGETVMDKKKIVGLAYALTGLLNLSIPWILFPVCGIESGIIKNYSTFGTHGCHGTLVAVSILALLTVCAGLAFIFTKNKISALAISFSVMIFSILFILFPFAITGMCRMPTMACRLGTAPALTIGSSLLFALSLWGISLSRKIQQ